MSRKVLSNVCKIVSDEIGVTPKVLISVSRKQHLVFGRMILSVICNHKLKIDVKDVAGYLKLSQRNIYHYINTTAAELKSNPNFRKSYETILERVNKNKALQKGDFKHSC